MGAGCVGAADQIVAQPPMKHASFARKCPGAEIRLQTAAAPKAISQSRVVVANTYMLYFRHNLEILQYDQYLAFRISDRPVYSSSHKIVAKRDS
jgi:hypothetical protein